MRFALYDLILGDSRIASNSILINQTLHHRGSRLWQNDRRSTTVSPWWRRFCGTSVDVPRGATWVTWAAGLGRRGSEDEVQREVETCRAECIIVGEVWGMGGTVLCGIRQLNILMVGDTFEALRGCVLGFWMETIGVATRTTADPNLDATPFGVALSLIPLSTRTFYVCDLFGVS